MSRYGPLIAIEARCVFEDCTCRNFWYWRGDDDYPEHRACLDCWHAARLHRQREEKE